MKPNKVTRGGEVKIIDSKVFPVTPISAAIVRLKPGGLRELHWHPNADEWQYYVSGKGRMTVFIGDARARTMDFQEGDVGYVLQSTPHYIENTGDTDLVFLEMFKKRQLPGHLAGRMDGAYTASADEPAPGRWNVNARWNPQTRDRDRSGVSLRDRTNNSSKRKVFFAI